MDILLGFFQSTDAPEAKSGQEHGYYEQREWRIGHTFGPHIDGSWLTEDRADDQSAVEFGRYLRSRDPCFFTEDRLRGTAILRGLSQPDELNRRSFFDFVTEVVCPSAVADTVATLLAAHGFQLTGSQRSDSTSVVHNAKAGAPTVFIRKERDNAAV